MKLLVNELECKWYARHMNLMDNQEFVAKESEIEFVEMFQDCADGTLTNLYRIRMNSDVHGLSWPGILYTDNCYMKLMFMRHDCKDGKNDAIYQELLFEALPPTFSSCN